MRANPHLGNGTAERYVRHGQRQPKPARPAQRVGLDILAAEISVTFTNTSAW